MAMRCLRIRSPICQFVRYNSPRAFVGAKPVVRVKTTSNEDEKELNEKLKSNPVKATYEPSPLFGPIKRAKMEKKRDAFTDPVAGLSRDRLKVTARALKPKPKKEGPKVPLTEEEKQYTYKSVRMKTSVKKLGNLARQIAHKDIDYAITQMRFSPKRQARLIFRSLEHAKEEAIRFKEMNDGKIVVDQAWVGRGTFRRQLWPRGRGRINVRMRPFTHFSVMLRSKEIVDKRVEKKKQKKLEKLGRWQSETKPIYNARPYYTW